MVLPEDGAWLMERTLYGHSHHSDAGVHAVPLLFSFFCLPDIMGSTDQDPKRALSPQPGRKCSRKRKHITPIETCNRKTPKMTLAKGRDELQQQTDLDEQWARSRQSQVGPVQVLPGTRPSSPLATERVTSNLSPSPSPEPPSGVGSTVLQDPLSALLGEAQGAQTLTERPARDAASSDLSASLAEMQASLMTQMKDLIAVAFTHHQMPSTSGPSAGGAATRRQRSIPTSRRDRTRDHSPSVSGEDSLHSGEEDQLLSDDGEDYAEPQMSSGLFRPALFRTLLSKAKAVTFLSDKADSAGDPAQPTLKETAQLLLTPQATTPEEVPAPLLVTDLVNKQWEVPAAGKPPLNSEKRFYNLPAAFASTLEPPAVDEPVVALTTSSAIVTDPAEALRPEEKRSEQVLRRGHLSAAWALKAASSASFFNRATLLWLRQLQARLSTEDVRLHQDVNKILAAIEFSADATLHAAKFAVRAIGSSVVARRLLWLKNWQADQKQKWKLASSAFKGTQLFGESLAPVLSETKDGKKQMSSGYRASDRKRASSFRRPNYRTYDEPSVSGQRFSPHRQDSAYRFDYSYKDRQQNQQRPFRGRQTTYNKRPFRNNRGRPFRRSK